MFFIILILKFLIPPKNWSVLASFYSYELSLINFDLPIDYQLIICPVADLTEGGGGGGVEGARPLSEFETLVMGLFVPLHAPSITPPQDLSLLV